MKIIQKQTTESYKQEQAEQKEITLNAGARFNHALIGNCGDLTVYVKRDAIYAPFLRSTKADKQETHLTINLVEPGAEVDLKGLLTTEHTQEIHSTVTINHLAEHTSSNQYVKTMANDESKIIADATITISEQAPHSSANQLAKNLLLSSKAQIQTEPKLQIDNDNVQASHGTSVGSLDKQALHYLQSRGIKKEEAKAILTDAFVNELLEEYDYE